MKRNGEQHRRAHFVPRQKGTLMEAEVAKFVEVRVAKVKRIAGVMEPLDAIPKNPMRCPELALPFPRLRADDSVSQSDKILRRQRHECATADLEAMNGLHETWISRLYDT